MVESARLCYIRANQKGLRCDAYKGLSDALTRGEVQPSSQGKRITLPSSFTGGARYMIQNYQDAMAICRFIGYPNLFITFTCNPKWLEIQRFLEKRNLKVEDRPDIVCRVFKMKLDAMIKDIKKGAVSKLHDGFSSPTFMDSIISAEISDKRTDFLFYTAVEEFMVHGPCGHAKRNSPCMVNDKCSKHFPKRFIDASQFDQDGYPLYRRRNDSRVVKKSGIELDNSYIVPHNRYLLLKYKAHINVEWCNQSRSIKYLFKYVNKGNDRVTAEFYKTTTDDIGNEVVNEINMYYDCRYISACEAMWRLFSFEVQYRTPPVERLSFHLPDCQSVVFQDDDSIDRVLNRESVAESMFNGWFIANQKYAEARQLSYIEMPTKFVWKKDIREWHPRKKGFSIGRILYVPPASDLCLTDDEKKNYGLLELDKLLEQQNRSLKDYHPMPIPEMANSRLVQNRLLFEELSYDREFLQQEALELCEKLTEEQRIIYDTVLDDISSKRGGLFFVYGYGGTGKTFMWRALSSELRSKGQIVLNVASSGIASLLLPGGRTAHSSCRIMRLTKNLRLNAMQDPVEQQATQEFANWIASIGDGKIGGPNDGYAEVEIPSTMLLASNGDHIETIVRSTFPIFANGNSNASYLQGRAILAPTLEVVNSVNEYMSELHTAESRTYFSCDTICKVDADAGILGDVHTPEILNGIRASGIPNHALTLKIGSPVMLLRNIDHSVGLCNGTRLVITKLADRVIEAELMDGANKGTKVLIPRMSMSPSDTRLPFKFQRRQFPLMLSYAMTINKSQG
ncbi:PREDICTED: uncharacterized protein LOC109155340 [Ipomoea nil]|uniref:uncharacterized protein LOC109155340 n=1 Tax=Ipomoea nil TaxID=35883 RepID=UPI000900A50A|nr:PREDICTED: uncharacterized protein LOC109155340 [Ipomoea nil]